MADHSHPTAHKRVGPASEQHSTPLGDSGSGWIACTTDSIIAMKDDLWDVLITMPPPHAANANEKIWPTVESPKGVLVKATQRDLRRFRTLKVALRRLATAGSAVDGDEGVDGDNSNETSRPRNLSRRQSRMSMSSTRTSGFAADGDDAHSLADAAEKIVEPMTWAALAYSGFMWWASAGEQRRSDEVEEQAHDNALIADLMPAPSMHNHQQQQQQQKSTTGQQHQRRPSGSFNVTAVQQQGDLSDSFTSLTARRSTTVDGLLPVCGEGGSGEEEERAKTELAIITYFHRLSAAFLSTLTDAVEAADEDDWVPPGGGRPETGESEAESEEESDQLLRGRARSDDENDDEDARSPVRVDSDALIAMGLDIWSDADAEFVRQGVRRYFNREAKVEGKGLELCGLKVC